MAVGDIGQRWAHLIAEVGTVGEKVKQVLENAAHEIDALFGSDSHPAQLSIIQHLEQATHVAVSSPALRAPADPTPAEPEPTDSATSPDTTLTGPSPASSEGSTS